MMKRTILATFALATLLFAGCAAGNDQIDKITADEAKAIALEEAGFTTTDVKRITAEMSDRNGVSYYDVDFEAGGKEYDYDVDALTGMVIADDLPEEVKAAAENKGAEEAKVEAAKPEEVKEEAAKAEAAKPEEAKAEVAKPEEAKAEAKAEAAKPEAKPAETAPVETKPEVTPEAKPDTSKNSSKLTEAEAKAIALAQVPGATASDIREFEVDYDDGRLEYEGKIIYDNMEYEFEIDGYSGAIRNWDVESIFD